jgi:hypothetical protein
VKIGDSYQISENLEAATNFPEAATNFPKFGGHDPENWQEE